MIGTNLKGVLFAVQSAVPLMSSGGSIILIGSTASVAPPAGMSIYGAIKAGSTAWSAPSSRISKAPVSASTP